MMTCPEVVILGRIGYDLYSEEPHVPLPQVRRFSRYLGGSSANMAVGLSRLGAQVGMVSCLGDESLSRFLIDFLQAEKVDTSHVKTAPGYLPSLCLTEVSPPDRFPQVFYRRDPVDTIFDATAGDLDFAASGRMFVTNGTSLCASPSRESTCLALERAKHAGARVVLDVDYRSMSWRKPEEAGLAARLALLDNRLLIASLNRGGLAGSSWELDDPMTGATPASCHAWRLDGAKILLRVDETEPASLKTMLASAHAINECNALALPMFLEPLPVKKTDKGYVVVKTAEALAKLAGVASALGDSSRYLWLKLPHCDGYETVARSTTLPILLLGGESAGDPSPFLRQLESTMSAGPNVRGALVGRNVLYPGVEDPLAMAEAAGGIVHDGWPIEHALESMAAERGRAMDRLAAIS